MSVQLIWIRELTLIEIQTGFLYFAEANRVYATTRRFKFPTRRRKKEKRKENFFQLSADVMTIVDSVDFDDFLDAYSPFSVLSRVSAEILYSTSKVGKRDERRKCRKRIK